MSRPRLRTIFLLALASVLLMAVPATAKKPSKEAGSVRVYRFDDLDVEGRVKAPQLMYFLKRIRSKFRSFRLPKQKFTHKIIETQHADFL
jgi:hypothetical protein